MTIAGSGSPPATALHASCSTPPSPSIGVVARGPFIAGSAQELQGYYRTYFNGDFPRAGDLVIPTAGAG